MYIKLYQMLLPDNIGYVMFEDRRGGEKEKEEEQQQQQKIIVSQRRIHFVLALVLGL